MASSGKKGKKNKGTVISLQSFLSNSDSPAGTTQVAKKIRNIDGDESDDGSGALPVVVQLPTAPRASRIFDDNSISHKPPFIAYLTNLPFDANEDDISNFFLPIQISSLRLPREDGETGRVRGFGYVEFENREDLIHVLSMLDPSIKGRRIRIELSNENEQQNNRQRGGNRRGFDGFGTSNENRDSGNWRRDNQNQDSGGFSNNYDRGYNRERKPTNEDNTTPGSWRTGSRPQASDVSPRRDRDSNDRHRDRDNDRHRDRDSNDRHREMGSRNRNFDRDDRDRTNTKVSDQTQERPKLNLKPRTLPLPDILTKPEDEEEIEISAKAESQNVLKASGAAPEKVFGAAKPVDTAAREKEIEERLAETKRQEKLKREEEQAEVTEKVSELQIEKNIKDNTNSAISWRNRSDRDESSKTEGRRTSPERHDDRRRDNRERDFNRSDKNRFRNDRSDNLRSKSNQNRDVKQRDEKPKRDVRTERPLPKYQPNQSGPVLQTLNKYSGLDDESSE